MRAITRRLNRVEERIRPVANTEHLRRLGARLEAARIRMARCGYPARNATSKSEVALGWTLSERLLRGRQMARAAAASCSADKS